MTGHVISLTTDFGLRDPYAVEMKAVILSICPTAVIVDVTHDVEKFNVRMGAFLLSCAAPYFPEGTIHLGVVDPGVGTQRRRIIVQTERGFFVGPDNGLLMLAAEAQGIRRVHEIRSRRLVLPHVSSTFHGRDIFAPAAAHMSNGVALEEFGPEISDAVKPDFAKTTRTRDSVTGEVLHVDGFGNIITNLRAHDLEGIKHDVMTARLGRHELQLRLSKTYADAEQDKPIALIGSHNYLEIALNQGDAARKLDAKPGDKVTFSIA
ncbi:MAG: S-adenosyl-l-methionine hydroxide adenosyltransferase family protein [Candidatus Bathyarchaeia archaeon]